MDWAGGGGGGRESYFFQGGGISLFLNAVWCFPLLFFQAYGKKQTKTMVNLFFGGVWVCSGGGRLE